MQRAGVNEDFGGSGRCWKQKIDAEEIGVGKSGRVESDEVSNTVLVNATLSL